MMKTNPQPDIAKLPGLSSIANEDTLELDIMAVQPGPGRVRRYSCYDHLQIDGRAYTDTDKLIDTITGRYTPFVNLYQTAVKLAGSPDGNYLTGLKMNFGIDGMNKICILYQAVGLINPLDLPQKQRQYDVNCDKDFYVYNSTKCVFEQTTDIAPITNYQNKMYIKHNDNAGTKYEIFKKGVDVESIIFSFQEIFALIYDNPYSNTVSVCNAIEMDLTQVQTPVKHSLLLAPNSLQLESLSGVYADLSHLCPPSCDKLIFTL